MPAETQDARSITPHITSLPHNLEAERALLGSLILDNARIDVATERIPPVALKQLHASRSPRRERAPQPEPLFFSQAHQLIFQALLDLHETNVGIDLTTLAEHLMKRGHLELVGGSPYLASLEDDIFSLSQVSEYVRIVVEKWRLRCLIRAVNQIGEEAVRTDEPAEQFIEWAEKQVFEVTQQRPSEDFVQIHDILPDLIEELEQRAKGPHGIIGLPTGFAKLDDMTGGLRASQLVILAARPSMGKTAFALNIAAHVAVRKKIPVGVFSLEMSKTELLNRVLCTEAHVSMAGVQGKRAIRRDELDLLVETGERLDAAPLYIDESSSLTVLELRARARRLKSVCRNLGLLVVDYLQLMNGSGRYDNRQQEVSEISRSLKILAGELEIPILALSQLSRQSEQRRGTRDRMPRLSDLRESGAIEQDADIVMFIHRERNMEVNNQGVNEPELATIRLGKQRNGPIGDFEMLFRGEFTEFIDIAHGESL